MANKDYPKPRMSLMPSAVALAVRYYLDLPTYTPQEVQYYLSRLGKQ